MNNQRLTASLGILTGVFFVTGFIILFLINPQTYVELNNISLASYNLLGMRFRSWIMVVYIVTGLLSTLFCISLISDNRNSNAGLIGKILLIICSLIWLSFGLFTYNPTSEIGNHLLIIRLVSFMVISFVGLILLTADYDLVAKDKFLKWYTLTSVSFIALLSFLSLFIYDETWIRTNLSLVIHFAWFTVFGIRLLTNKPKTAF